MSRTASGGWTAARSLLVCLAILAGQHGRIIAARPEENPRFTSAPPVADDSVFQVGEELTYNVSYASIDLGQVRFKIVDSFEDHQKRYYTTAAYINSYRGVPFVDLHAVYESVMESGEYSHRFFARHKVDEFWRTVLYEFDYDHHTLRLTKGRWKSDTVVARDSLPLDTSAQDGLSLLYAARRCAHEDRQLRILTFVNEKRGITRIDLPGERTEEKIDAVKYPIDLIHIEGSADFVGIFGLTGDFEGWFSNDDACVPILANMKVLIGKIRIELVSWKRAGWTPPPRVRQEDK